MPFPHGSVCWLTHGSTRCGCHRGRACARIRHRKCGGAMKMLTLLRRRGAPVVMGLAICSLLLGGCASGASSLPGATTPLPNGVLPNFAHVFIIMLENRGY